MIDTRGNVTPAELRATLLRLGLSQADLARATGHHVPTVNRWVNGWLPVPCWLPGWLEMYGIVHGRVTQEMIDAGEAERGPGAA